MDGGGDGNGVRASGACGPSYSGFTVDGCVEMVRDGFGGGDTWRGEEREEGTKRS